MHTATRRGSPGANVVLAAAAPLLGNAEAATITAIAGGPGEGPALSFGQQSVRVAVLSGRTKHMCPSVHPALLPSCLLAASLAYLHECLGSLAVSVILSTGQAAFATCPNQAGVYERVGRAGWLMEMRSFAIADPVFLVSGSMGRERGRGGGARTCLLVTERRRARLTRLGQMARLSFKRGLTAATTSSVGDPAKKIYAGCVEAGARETLSAPAGLC